MSAYRSLAVVIIATAALVAACTNQVVGSGRQAAGVPASSSGTDPGNPPGAVPDAARLTALMTIDQELSGDWTTTGGPSHPTLHESSEDAKTRSCAGGRDISGDAVAVGSTNYRRGLIAIIVARAVSYRSPVDVSTFEALINGPKYVACAEQTLQAAISLSGQVSDIRADVSIGPAQGPSNVLATLTVTGRLTSEPALSTTVSETFIRGARVIASVLFTETSVAPISDAQKADVVAVLAQRVAAA